MLPLRSRRKRPQRYVFWSWPSQASLNHLHTKSIACPPPPPTTTHPYPGSEELCRQIRPFPGQPAHDPERPQAHLRKAANGDS